MAWLSGWTYRKSITLSRASGAVTDYQMKLLVGESSGAAGEDVDCNSHVQADFDDLRFTTSDGQTLLDYWIESMSGATPNGLATVWIEFDSIGTGATTFYMYYGKADATAVSNGTNTFIQFDNFEWGNDGDAIDTSGGSIVWSKTVAGTSLAEIDTAQKYSGTRSLHLYRDGTNSPFAYFTQVVDTNYSVRFRCRKDDTSNIRWHHGDGANRKLLYVEADEDITVHDGTSYIDTGANATINTWELYELNDFDWDAETMDVWFNNALVADDADTSTGNTTNNNQISFGDGLSTSEIWVDDVIIRKWAAVEPAWGSWGDETPAGWANIAKVCGVTATDLSKVDGIAVADIAKICGVAV